MRFYDELLPARASSMFFYLKPFAVVKRRISLVVALQEAGDDKMIEFESCGRGRREGTCCARVDEETIKIAAICLRAHQQRTWRREERRAAECAWRLMRVYPLHAIALPP